MNSHNQQADELVLLVDFDGCFEHFNGVGPWDKKTSYYDYLINKNKPLLDNIIKQLKDSKTTKKKVKVCIGSNRQDVFEDANKYIKDSCAFMLPAIVYYLSIHLPKEKAIIVYADPVQLADIYQNKPAGHTYEQFLETVGFNKDGKYQYNNEIIEKLCAVSDNVRYVDRDEIFKKLNVAVLDEIKITLIYAHAHRTALSSNNNIIDLYFYDDRHDILTGLLDFYKKNSDLLPKNVRLHLKAYNGVLDQTDIEQEFKQDSIEGKGDIDCNYDMHLKGWSATRERKEDKFHTSKMQNFDDIAAYNKLQHSNKERPPYENAIRNNAKSLIHNDTNTASFKALVEKNRGQKLSRQKGCYNTVATDKEYFQATAPLVREVVTGFPLVRLDKQIQGEVNNAGFIKNSKEWKEKYIEEIQNWLNEEKPNIDHIEEFLKYLEDAKEHPIKRNRYFFTSLFKGEFSENTNSWAKLSGLLQAAAIRQDLLNADKKPVIPAGDCFHWSRNLNQHANEGWEQGIEIAKARN